MATLANVFIKLIRNSPICESLTALSHVFIGLGGEFFRFDLTQTDFDVDTAPVRGAVDGMERKDHIDLFGAGALILFALNLAFNQVVIKVTAEGISPMFQAGLRSAGAIFVLLIWMKLRGIGILIPRKAWAAGVLSGLLFAMEFFSLFNALDITTVSRASVIFYSMPVWLALMAHFLLPGERLTMVKSLGLSLAMIGVAVALADRGGGTVSWMGDFYALMAALSWACIALCIRLTSLKEVQPAQQLFLQVLVSAPILLILAPFFGPLIRDIAPIHIAGLLLQIFAVASFGYLAWFWLMSIYPASSVASFSFLSPVVSVFLGWLLLSEEVSTGIFTALALVAAGIFLVNRKPRAA